MFRLLRKLFANPERRRIYRANRVRLYPVQQIEFAREDDPANPFFIANISSSGIGLVRREKDHWPPPGSELRGKVLVDRAFYPLTLRIVHVSTNVIGATLVEDLSELWKRIERHLSIELAAANMAPVRSEILKQEDDGQPRLFRNSQGCELFYVESGKRMIRFEFSFFGHYIEGGRGLRTRFGHLQGDDAKEKPKYSGTAIVRLVSSLPPETLDTAVKFLQHMPELDPAQRELLIQSIRQNSRKPSP